MDEDKFYRRASTRLCSSLQIEKALHGCLLSIRDHIPADALALHLFDPGLSFIETPVIATVEGGSLAAVRTRLPAEVREQVRDFVDLLGGRPHCQIVVRLGDDPFASLIAREMEVDVEFMDVAWDSIIPTLVTGKADLIMSGMTATPMRALSVSYSDPYFHTVTCLLVSRRKAPDLKGLADLNAPGRVVVVKEGTTGHFAAQRKCKEAKIVSVKTENDAANEVVLGRADAFLYDLWSIRNHNRNHPDTTFVITTPVSREPYAIACRKGDPETLTWLNLVLRTFRLDGRLQELYDKYGLEDVRDKIVTGLPLLAGITGSVVGSLCTRPPDTERVNMFLKRIYTPIGQEEMLERDLDEVVPPGSRLVTFGGLFIVKPTRQTWMGFTLYLAMCIACVVILTVILGG